jgi:hypothetical protein
VGWLPGADGSVTIAVRCHATPVEARLEPHSSAFSENLALVATTFFLAFANRAIQRMELRRPSASAQDRPSAS